MKIYECRLIFPARFFLSFPLFSQYCESVRVDMSTCLMCPIASRSLVRLAAVRSCDERKIDENFSLFLVASSLSCARRHGNMSNHLNTIDSHCRTEPDDNKKIISINIGCEKIKFTHFRWMRAQWGRIKMFSMIYFDSTKTREDFSRESSFDFHSQLHKDRNWSSFDARWHFF